MGALVHAHLTVLDGHVPGTAARAADLELEDGFHALGSLLDEALVEGVEVFLHGRDARSHWRPPERKRPREVGAK